MNHQRDMEHLPDECEPEAGNGESAQVFICFFAMIGLAAFGIAVALEILDHVFSY